MYLSQRTEAEVLSSCSSISTMLVVSLVSQSCFRSLSIPVLFSLVFRLSWSGIIAPRCLGCLQSGLFIDDRRKHWSKQACQSVDDQCYRHVESNDLKSLLLRRWRRRRNLSAVFIYDLVLFFCHHSVLFFLVINHQIEEKNRFRKCFCCCTTSLHSAVHWIDRSDCSKALSGRVSTLRTCLHSNR